MNDGQGKTGGLAGAGLGRAHHILAGHDHRDGLFLNRGGFAVTEFGHSSDDRLSEAEIIECQG